MGLEIAEAQRSLLNAMILDHIVPTIPRNCWAFDSIAKFYTIYITVITLFTTLKDKFQVYLS